MTWKMQLMNNTLTLNLIPYYHQGAYFNHFLHDFFKLYHSDNGNCNFDTKWTWDFQTFSYDTNFNNVIFKLDEKTKITNAKNSINVQLLKDMPLTQINDIVPLNEIEQQLTNDNTTKTTPNDAINLASTTYSGFKSLKLKSLKWMILSLQITNWIYLWTMLILLCYIILSILNAIWTITLIKFSFLDGFLMTFCFFIVCCIISYIILDVLLYFQLVVSDNYYLSILYYSMLKVQFIIIKNITKTTWLNLELSQYHQKNTSFSITPRMN